jgi:hypothetical protein
MFSRITATLAHATTNPALGHASRHALSRATVRSFRSTGAAAAAAAAAQPPREPNRFKQLSETDLEFLSSVTTVLTDPDDVAPFNSDWMGKYKGNTAAVVLPHSTDQVSAILK